jgi:hypothetical protein
MKKTPHPLDLRDIRTATNQFQLDGLVKKLIDNDCLSDIAVSEIEKRINNDGYKPRNDLIIYLIIHQIIPSLYNSIKYQLRFLDTEKLVALYQSKFPDREIEEILIKRLYELSMGADQPDRRYIVEAMIKVGSTETISTRETIEGELRDKASAANTVGNILPRYDKILYESQYSFHQLVCKAINVVTARGSPPAPLYSMPAALVDDPIEAPAGLQNLPIENLIEKGEGEQIEFKQTLRWDVQQDALHKPLEDQCLKAIAAFANSKGGTLLIGVSDDGRVPGLDLDLATVAESRDKFDLHLTNLIKSRFSASFRAGCVSVSYPTVNEKLVCRVDVKPSRIPVYLAIKDVQGQASDRFIVRLGASSQEMPLSQALAYIREHFES